MFKKVINVLVLFVMVAGIIVSLVNFSTPLFSVMDSKDRAYLEEGGGSSGNTAIYNRYDFPCPDGIKEKTNCTADGNEQCTAQYCN